MIVSFQDVLDRCHTLEKPTLLTGNGFSIACDARFLYRSLYAELVDKGISKQLMALFQKLGTNDFEGVLRLLDDAQHVAEIYGATLPEDVADDRELLKQALLEILSEHHPDVAATIDDARWQNARTFLRHFGNVFTTNYDLLLYWACMDSRAALLSDGFGSHPATDALCFTYNFPENQPQMWHLHGALHYYEEDGLVLKHSSRSREPITDLVRDGIDDGKYPLFVAEGDPSRKAQQIRRNGYLNAARLAFENVSGPLVTFGFKFGAMDRHLVDAVGSNTKIEQLFVGLYGDGDSADNLAIQGALADMRERHHRQSNLTITYFDTASAAAWGATF